MFCKNCGIELAEGSKFCQNCGTVQEEQTVASVKKEEEKYSWKAIVGCILALVGIFALALPCGILGMIFSALGLQDIINKNIGGKGLAVAGLIVAIADAIFGLIYICL